MILFIYLSGYPSKHGSLVGSLSISVDSGDINCRVEHLRRLHCVDSERRLRRIDVRHQQVKLVGPDAIIVYRLDLHEFAIFTEVRVASHNPLRLVHLVNFDAW